VYVKALADTSALLAYLDAADRWHERCRLAFGQFRLPLTTSTAVLTELFHLVGDGSHEMDITWKFVRSGAITVAPISDRDLPDIEALMRKYRD
jgi:predicted nucleic acid-binding protein